MPGPLNSRDEAPSGNRLGSKGTQTRADLSSRLLSGVTAARAPQRALVTVTSRTLLVLKESWAPIPACRSPCPPSEARGLTDLCWALSGAGRQ